jgi:alkylation response protein AidB-like acyl-CoA dehydrogenase
MDSQIEPEELRDSARRFLEKAVDRRAPYGSPSPDDLVGLRVRMAELGWMLLITPAEFGGLGQSFAALAPIYQELGRALARVAFSGTMAAADVLTAVGSPESREILARIGSGEVVIAIAEVDLRREDERVSGTLQDVWDARGATHLLRIPGDSREASVLLIDLEGDGVTLRDVPMWDRTRNAADVQLDGAHAIVLQSGPDARILGDVARAHLDLAIACDSLGGADRVLAEAITYMATRRQFNRPIGSFQALKHRCADLKVTLEIARAFTDHACTAYVERRQGWGSIAAQAKLLASEAYRSIAEESVQFHGGIGFTWEHDCHLFLKRALLNEMLGGTPEQYRDRIAPDVLRRAIRGTNR